MGTARNPSWPRPRPHGPADLGRRPLGRAPRRSGRATRFSVATGGAQGNKGSFTPSVSADGRYVAFASEATNLVPGDTNGATDIFVHDRETGRTVRVSVPSRGGQINGDSWTPSISGDGRYVAFATDADNVTPGDDNGALAASPDEREGIGELHHALGQLDSTNSTVRDNAARLIPLLAWTEMPLLKATM